MAPSFDQTQAQQVEIEFKASFSFKRIAKFCFSKLNKFIKQNLVTESNNGSNSLVLSPVFTNVAEMKDLYSAVHNGEEQKPWSPFVQQKEITTIFLNQNL